MNPEVFGTLFFLFFVVLFIAVCYIREKKGKKCNYLFELSLVFIGCMSVHIANLICNKVTIDVDELEQLRKAAEMLAQMQ